MVDAHVIQHGYFIPGPTLQSFNKISKISCGLFTTSLEDTKAKHISYVQNSLVIESTAAAGGVAIFDDGFCEFSVQFISQSTGHAFPGQDDNNNNRIGTVVPRPLLHNA